MTSISDFIPFDFGGSVSYEKQEIMTEISENNFPVCEIRRSKTGWRTKTLGKEEREIYVHFKEGTDGNVYGRGVVYDPIRCDVVDRFRLF